MSIRSVLLFSILMLTAPVSTVYAQQKVTSTCHFAGARCGLVGAEGEMVMEPQYDYLSPVVDGYAVYGQGLRYGLIDDTGKVTIEAQYEDMQVPQQGYAVAVRDGRTMALTVDGSLAVPPAYDQIYILGEGYFLVGKKIPGVYQTDQADWSVYDAVTGRTTKLPRDTLVTMSYREYPLRFVMGDRMSGYQLYAHNGELLLDGIEQVHLARGPVYVFKKDGQFGAIDREGRGVVPFEFDSWKAVEDRPEFIMSGAGDPQLRRRRRYEEAGMKWVYIGWGSAEGEGYWLDSTGLLTRDEPCPDGLRLRKKGEKQMMIIDRDGKPAPRGVWNRAVLLCNRPSLVGRDGRYGYVYPDGTLVGGYMYDYPGLANFRDGITEVWLASNRMVVFDLKGQRLLGPLDVNRKNFYARYPEGITREVVDKARRDPDFMRFNEFRYCSADAVTIHRKGNRYVFRDVTGEVIARGEFEEVSCFKRGLAPVVLPYPKRWCRMDKRGHVSPDACLDKDPHPEVTEPWHRKGTL